MSLKEYKETDVLRSKVSKQRTEIARLTQRLENAVEHRLRLESILRSAVSDEPGWRENAIKEVAR